MFPPDADRLPTGLWLEAELRKLDLAATPYYVVHRGNHATGLVLLKVNGLRGHCALWAQERNFDSGALDWVAVLGHELLDEFPADQYIQRALARDPDLWVVEVEDSNLRNPFKV